MTDDEMIIETYRYRAPTVLALSGGRFAILIPGRDPPVRVIDPTRAPALQIAVLWDTIQAYTEWNILPEANASASDAELLAALGMVQANGGGV